MPKHRNSSVSITFFNLKGFLGTPEFREGGTAGKRSTFSRGEQSAVDFEDLMEVQAALFD